MTNEQFWTEAKVDSITIHHRLFIGSPIAVVDVSLGIDYGRTHGQLNHSADLRRLVDRGTAEGVKVQHRIW